jgi:hypothetical protein
LYRFDAEDGLEESPKLFNPMMLLRDIPYLRTATGDATQVHQVKNTGCLFRKKEQNNVSKSWAVGGASRGWGM